MSDYTHMYELRADVLNADPDDYDNSREFALREPLQENLERLVPYLTTDGDCHVSLPWDEPSWGASVRPGHSRPWAAGC
jgi:hypothetical protein